MITTLSVTMLLLMGSPNASRADDKASSEKAKTSFDAVYAEPIATVVQPSRHPMAAVQGPDFSVDPVRLSQDMHFERNFYDSNSCEVQEACVDAPGWRTILRFNARAINGGDQDFELGDPSDPKNRGIFVWSPCHGHYHVKGWMDYSLTSAGAGAHILIRHQRKQAFCLEDTDRVTGSKPGKYTCGFQGITAGWSDEYNWQLPCQWVDVTGVAPGDYVLRLTVNPDRLFKETNYDNDIAEVKVTIPPQASEVTFIRR